jgi:hypothetical protein
MSEKTNLEVKMQILAELWIEYRKDEEFKEFIAYNDLGLPLAYAISEGIVESTPPAEKFIEETFELLLAGLGIEDENFDNLDDLLGLAEEQ